MRHCKNIDNLVKFCLDFDDKVTVEKLTFDGALMKMKLILFSILICPIHPIWKTPVTGLWTGARVSDLLNFTLDNTTNGFIEYQTQKTKQKIMLPVHWQVQSTIEFNNGQFPRKISHQRYNDWIKIIYKKTGITQLCKGAIYLVEPDKKGKRIKHLNVK